MNNIQKYIDISNKNLQAIFRERSKKPDLITLDDLKKCLKKGDLLSVDADAKTTKGSKNGYLTGILYMAAHKLSGLNVCSFASKGCIGACLNFAGLATVYPTVLRARTIKTLAFFYDRPTFIKGIEKSIVRLQNKAIKKDMMPVVRLNGTSDLEYHKFAPTLFSKFKDIQFYDYTKNPKRAIEHGQGLLPKNYHITFSKSESNDKSVSKVLQAGGNVAAVFNGGLPNEYLSFKVIDGDKTDLRFLDKGKGSIIGLKAKGKAKKDLSGFTIQLNDQNKLKFAV